MMKMMVDNASKGCMLTYHKLKTGKLIALDCPLSRLSFLHPHYPTTGTLAKKRFFKVCIFVFLFFFFADQIPKGTTAFFLFFSLITTFESLKKTGARYDKKCNHRWNRGQETGYNTEQHKCRTRVHIILTQKRENKENKRINHYSKEENNCLLC